ncbi:MAG: hypothetical protein TREMPRED_005875 [Tremellales sp. Tagirdzhanova-0007]|nr:MAG: hypothetical protein TREMPRED_005875 [Tremellales sp. Tagirdzhanova-0007]
MRWDFASARAGSTSSHDPSDSSGSFSVTPITPVIHRWDVVIQDEEQYQERQYPTPEDLPSCMSLMDEFFMCYALVPQLRNFYRYGIPRDCTWRWKDFKYCLSLKSEPQERRVEGSSEDVWALREKPLENFPPLYPEEIQSDEVVQ